METVVGILKLVVRTFGIGFKEKLASTKNKLFCIFYRSKVGKVAKKHNLIYQYLIYQPANPKLVMDSEILYVLSCE